MQKIRIKRTIQIPDPVRISLYRKAPELGPKILFFSGGTALNDLSRVLKNHTHNSIHMVTPFDSGGSSAKLRMAFDMPSIGDLRSRLMALANETITGNPEVYQLVTYRFPVKHGKQKLQSLLDSMIDGREPLVAAIPNPVRRIIRNQLGYFRDAMPDEFDLRGASTGNLILAGGYLKNHQHLDTIIFLFAKLVGVLGTVRAIVNDNLHLCAELEDGSRIIGQHMLTGKEVPSISSPVKHLSLSSRLDRYVSARSEIRKKNRKLIEKADLICYPPGSFYSSLVANLLPSGVGSAVGVNDCPKVYIPNLGHDPEQLGMSMDRAVRTLIHYLRSGASPDCSNDKMLDFVLIDSKKDRYPSILSPETMKELGIQLIETRLVSKKNASSYDPELLTAALVSLA